MPILRKRKVLQIARGITAFLYLDTGWTRGDAPVPTYAMAAARVSEQGRAEIMSREGTVNAGSVVWIFGVGRSGSTWLMNMMSEMPKTSTWNEPMIGRLFGEFYENAEPGRKNSRAFVLGKPAKEGWIPLIRRFVLESIRFRYPDLGMEGYLVVKEPNSSVGAPLISEALPESRIIFLVRDPRDVVASVLDGARTGSWLYERKRGRRGQESVADTSPDKFVERRAKMYTNHITSAKRAYEAHRGPKVLVRYEELRSDTLATMKRIYSELGIGVDEGELQRAVRKHAWENIPEEKKGEGKKFRKAESGSWREDLTPEQARTVEQITAPLLKEFYPE